MAKNECIIMTLPILGNNDELLNNIYDMFKQFNEIVDSKDIEAIPFLMEIITANDIEDLVKLEAIYTIKILLPLLDNERRISIEEEINFHDSQIAEILKNL
ncbi:MAG: hypothetical protein ACTSP4_10015 [Candidatus Hodarchaeales archaeon]